MHYQLQGTSMFSRTRQQRSCFSKARGFFCASTDRLAFGVHCVDWEGVAFASIVTRHPEVTHSASNASREQGRAQSGHRPEESERQRRSLVRMIAAPV